tara:strand:+ start:860 stop:1744 length:885 start_codon:yes stop_codon:yes gene_type:complete
MGFKLFRPKTWKIGAGKGKPLLHHLTPWKDQSLSEHNKALGRSKFAKGLHKYVYNPLVHGYLGDYEGDDDLLGLTGANLYESKDDSRRGLENVLKGLGQGKTPKGRYGLGEGLRDAGIDYSFDVTDAKSLGEALAKAQFEKQMVSDLEGGDYASAVGTYGSGKRSVEGYGYIKESDYEKAWDEFQKEQGDAFYKMGSMYALNPFELSQLDPASKKWRDMLNPRQAEATDIYGEQIESIYSGIGGDIQTGEAARKRKDALDMYGQNILSARGDVRSAREGQMDKTLEDILSAFQS